MQQALSMTLQLFVFLVWIIILCVVQCLGMIPPRALWYVALQEVCISLQEVASGSVLPVGHEAFGQILAPHQAVCCRT